MRLWLPALLSVSLVAAPATADDVPLPVKKPRDAKGQPIVGDAKGAQPVAARGAGVPGKDASKDSKDKKKAAAQRGQERQSKKALAAPSPAANSGEPKPAGANAGKGQLPDNAKATAWPKTLEEANAEAEAKAKPETIATEWPAEEIAAALAMCKTILAKIDAVALPEEPFRHGECGTPAPVRLISIGSKPEVALSPPPILTCGMVGALHTWLTKDLQPLARKALGTDIIKIESMSDYSCRNAYGRTKTKLSEHGRANALDIRGFMTAKGEAVAVLTGWGETQRDIAARELALKKAAEKAAEAARIAAPAAAPAAAGAAAAANEGAADDPIVRKTIVEGAPGAAGTPAFSVAPARLGGPVAAPAPPTRMRSFLKSAHAAACQIFGTTLGPEANNAHRNHFHVDMAPRTRLKICD